MDRKYYKPELEEELWSALQERLPERVFDCHYHMYPGHLKSYAVTGDRDADISYWRQALGKLVGQERLAGALVMPSIVKSDQMDLVNAFVRREAASQAGFCVAHLVSPQDDPDETEQLLADNPLITSFKPYFRYSPANWSSSLDEYFPEWIARLADRRHMSVTLHLAREREALSDPINYRLIQKYCEKYPNMRLVLAHNALGHNIENLRRGLPHILAYPNIWFDSSGISESASNSYILEYFGPKRLMFGSDLPLGNVLGKIHSSGNGLVCLMGHEEDWVRHFKTEQYITSLYEFNTECLISLLTAADQWNLAMDDLADIFYNNAAWVYRLQEDGLGPATDKDQFERSRYKKSLGQGQELLPLAGLHSSLYDQNNTPFLDLASEAAQNSPLGFREHATTAAARKAVCLALPDQTTAAAAAYGQRLSQCHSWAGQAAVGSSGLAALDLALAAARKLTGQDTVLTCLAWPGPAAVPAGLVQLPVVGQDLEQALLCAPAALLIPVEGFYTTNSSLYQAAALAARQAKVPLIYDERRVGFRRPPGSLPQSVPSPDAAVYGASAANGYPLGALVASPDFWPAVEKQAWPAADAAALAAAQFMLDLDPAVYKSLGEAGARLVRAWQDAADSSGLAIQLKGHSIFPCFEFTGPAAAGLRQAYRAEMAASGILADTFAHIQLSDYHEHSLAGKISQVFAQLALN